MSHPLVVCLAGAGSATGRGLEVFADVIRYLIVAGGYVREDFVEASYRIGPGGEPLAYGPADSEASLRVSVPNVGRDLIWYHYQTGRRLHLLGWSLGGVVLFEAAAALSTADPTWSTRIGALVTLSSPLLGSDLDGIDLIGGFAAGDVGSELARRAADEDEKDRVRSAAARLRASGVRLVTLAEQEDAIVTPEDALLPALGPQAAAFILRPRRRAGGPYLESVLGHGNLPRDPDCWRRVLEALGPAE